MVACITRVDNSNQSLCQTNGEAACSLEEAEVGRGGESSPD